MVKKDDTKGLSVTRVSNIQIQPWGYISPFPINIPICQLFEFRIMLLILLLSLEIDNSTIKMVWFRYRYVPEIILHVCLSISYQLCCKTELVYFLFQLNSRPNCLIVDNLSWSSVFQDNTNNHTSGLILVFGNFLKPDFIGSVNYSWRYIISCLLPTDWTWNLACPILPWPGFSMMFQDEYFSGSMINYFFVFHPFLVCYIFLLICCTNNSSVCAT